MSKCPNCGVEVDVGMKFCGECGAKMPAVKKCPKCGAEMPDTMKFCGACGCSLSGGNETGGGGFALGDKNVIAGDVTLTQNIIHEDETKKVVSCGVCGRSIAVTDAFRCAQCGKSVCHDHYVEGDGLCAKCHAAKVDGAEKEYCKELEIILEDGIIDQDEFEQLEELRKKLGISAPRAMALQNQMKTELKEKKSPSHGDVHLMTVEKAQFERAVNKLYDDGKCVEACNLVAPIYKSHPFNEEVLAVYLAAMMGIDEDKTRSIITALPIDLASAYLTSVDIEIKHGELASAEIKLAAAERLWPNETRAKVRRILLMYLTAKQSNDRAYLAEAMDLLTSLPPASDRLMASWQFFLQYVISQYLGDEVPELTRDFCRGEGVYCAFVRGELYGLKSEEEECALDPNQIESELKRANELYETAEESDDDEDYALAYNAFMQVARAGDSQAFERLGLMCRDGKGTVKNYKDAADWFVKAANAGKTNSLYYLSGLYAEGGYELRQDKDKALHYMRQCASNDDVDACEKLGDWHREGLMGLDKDTVRGVVYYQQAANKGSVSAMYKLGVLYRDGEGVVADKMISKKWFSSVIESADTNSQFRERAKKEIAKIEDSLKMSDEDICAIVHRGVDADRNGDYSLAIKCFRTAAQSGDGRALRNLGVMYRRGNGVEKDVERWLELTKKSVEAGSGAAAADLADAYLTGQDVPKDEKMCLYYFDKAVEMELPSALFFVGRCHCEGLEPYAKDVKKGIKLLKHAAELGSARALACLGEYCEDGLGSIVVKSFEQAAIFYKKAIDVCGSDKDPYNNYGRANAARDLAWLCAKGRGGCQRSDALRYIRMSIEWGNVLAMDDLGEWYEGGRHGLPVDDEKAVRYYRMAAENGSEWGMYHLGLMYKNGKGVAADRKEAISWLEKSAGMGHKKASEVLATMK